MNGFNNNTSTYVASNLFGIKKYIFLIPSEVKKKLPKIRWKLCFSSGTKEQRMHSSQKTSEKYPKTSQFSLLSLSFSFFCDSVLKSREGVLMLTSQIHTFFF